MTMIKAILLTFIVTALSMMVAWLSFENRKQRAEGLLLRKKNDELRRRISQFNELDRDRRERSAYDKGLYDGRSTDALYRQCLKRFSAREQADVMMNGEQEECAQ